MSKTLRTIEPIGKDPTMRSAENQPSSAFFLLGECQS
jgi:hypothetical protein